eukprot:456573_1
MVNTDRNKNNNIIMKPDRHTTYTTEQDSDCTDCDITDIKAQKRTHCIDYEVFQWIFVIFFTLIAVIDRFTLNMWPLWVDSPGPLIPGNFSVSCFSLIAWISSRVLLVSSSYIFLFQCHVFWNWFVEIKCVNKYIKINDIRQTNAKLHYHIGWLFVGIPVVLHVWVILFAACFPQNDIFIYNSWSRPSNEQTGKTISFYKDNLLSLGLNDVYRIASTSLTFFILIPYSVITICRNHNWSFAQWIHLFGATIYTIDLLRMYSHPHCWVFNIPFILWWILDRLYGIFYYRRCVANVVKKTVLDEQYIILYLRIPEKFHLKHTIGDIFYFNTLSCGWDRAHPFTVFQNHKRKNKMIHSSEQLLPGWRGHKFSIYNPNNEDDDVSEYIMSRASTVYNDHVAIPLSTYNRKMSASYTSLISIDEKKEKENEKEECDWNIGIIMQVVPNHSDCYYRKTWTSLIASYDTRYMCGLRCWGPFRSDYRTLINYKQNETPIVLIGTGAGCSFLLDFYHYIVANDINLTEIVHFYFSTRSITMFQWFTDITCHKNINNLFVNAHLTSHDNITYNKKLSSFYKSRDSQIGRASFQEILKKAEKNTNVYFCGSPNIQLVVRKLCQKLKLTYHAGHSFHA